MQTKVRGSLVREAATTEQRKGAVFFELLRCMAPQREVAGRAAVLKSLPQNEVFGKMCKILACLYHYLAECGGRCNGGLRHCKSILD